MLKKERDVDGIAAILSRLQSKDAPVREHAAVELHSAVATLARELTSETFARFLSDLTPRLLSLLQSPHLVDQLGGIAAVDALIPIASEAQIIRFANYLRSFFVSCDGTLVAAFVDFEVKRAFEWLTNPSFQSNHRRLAACMVLEALASAVPTLFHVNLNTFFVAIWPAIRDPRVEVREAARDALSACLQLVSLRQTRNKLQWYCKIYDQVQEGLSATKAVGLSSVLISKSTPWENIHGSLLIIGELLKYTGGFVMPRFREVCDVVLSFKDAKDKLVSRYVCALLPKLAAYCPDAFVRHYLDFCIAHLMKQVTNFVAVANRDVAFFALGKLALTVGDRLVLHIPAIVDALQDGMKKSKRYCTETLLCAVHLSKSCPIAIEPFLPALLEQMLSGCLNEVLVEALTEIVETLPSSKTWVQERLLLEIASVFRRPEQTEDENKIVHTFSLISYRIDTNDLVVKDAANEVIRLALKTLTEFNFNGPFSILPFVQEDVSAFLYHPNIAIRKQAVTTCTTLQLPYLSLPKRGRSWQTIDSILHTLIQVGLADEEWTVRKTVVESLLPAFDQWLAQESNLNMLFYLLNDEQVEIREFIMDMLERLTSRNPAFVLPMLRRVLIQVLAELEHAFDTRMMEESLRLLSKLFRGSQHLVEPYLRHALDVLVPKLQLQGNPNITTRVLNALGSLAQAAQTQVAPFQPVLLPLILDALQDHSSTIKRHVALVTLGQLTTSTGNVMQPYVTHPKVLHTLLDLLQHTAATPWTLRCEAMKIIGVLGAIDPYTFKILLSRVPLEISYVQFMLDLKIKSMLARAIPRAGEDKKQDISLQISSAAQMDLHLKTHRLPIQEDPLDLALSQQQSNATPLLVSSEAYFPTVAIEALLGILREPSLSMHHYGLQYHLQSG
ncbi:hypothetical protein AeRB84_005855 [Aphanomyces euteiches]|nr:hypothetical protein AeRB84_005855 [Aphanomyces euteiches]